MVVTQIYYNWYADDRGPLYSSYEVGEEDVIEIVEHPAIGEGDRWFYDVKFEDGSMERIFNPNKVFYKSEDNG